jgi:AcrR family transcriptional regulator
VSASTFSKTATNTTARQVAKAAARLFAERGYDATSVREIVAAAGITKPTLYYHFGSKEGLAHALLTLPLSNLVATLRHIVTVTSDPILCLEQVMEAQYAWCRDDPDRGRFIYAVMFGPLRAEVAAEVDGFKADLLAWTEAAVRRLAEAGIITRERVDACCTACRGLIVISTLDFLYTDKHLRSDLARRQVHDLIGGFNAQQPSADRE